MSKYKIYKCVQCEIEVHTQAEAPVDLLCFTCRNYNTKKREIALRKAKKYKIDHPFE